MVKINYMNKFSQFYVQSAKNADIVAVPEMNFLMVDGKGDPNTSQAFADAVEALYSLSYTLKFMVKKGAMAIDYGVMPLQALWWSDDMTTFGNVPKDDWRWTVMIMQPEFITQVMINEATGEVGRKKKLVALPLVRFQAFSEGKVAQILHIGPFSEEGPTIEKLHAFIEQSGSQRIGKHHEIFLSDIRRAAPEKWKTIVRQPMT